MNKKELDFYNQLDVSERTLKNYTRALNSTFLKDVLKEHFGIDNIFEISDIKKLWDIYSIINIHPKNVKNHRSYSAAIMKYIKFINNGEKYGRRIDYRKRRKI